MYKGCNLACNNRCGCTLGTTLGGNKKTKNLTSPSPTNFQICWWNTLRAPQHCRPLCLASAFSWLLQETLQEHKRNPSLRASLRNTVSPEHTWSATGDTSLPTPSVGESESWGLFSERRLQQFLLNLVMGTIFERASWGEGGDGELKVGTDSWTAGLLISLFGH